MSNHILITGTGRAGTTFLVQLLTLLGFDTGFTEKDFKTLIHPISLGGLEHDIRKPGPKPYIIKSPWICDYIDEIMLNKDIVIDHIIIPILGAVESATGGLISHTITNKKYYGRWSLGHRISKKG